MQKKANILDFPKVGLSPEIWNEDNTLKPDVKQFILDFISSFAQANNFKDTFSWLKQIKFVGSLTTNLWNSASDVDIHCEVDLPKFVEVEHPEMSEKEASDFLDGIRKQVDQVKAKVSGTEHPLEIFFENEFTNRASQQFSGTYSVLEDKWLADPHIVGQDFDIATLHPDLLNLAKETASELDSTFGEIKRDVQDIKELNETINDWPAEQRELFEKKLQKRLDTLTKEIEDLIVIREDVAEKRKHYDAISEQEVRFKYLQKYYYMHVLTDLKTLLKQSPNLTVKDIPVVENIMTQASLENMGYFISPDGEIFDLESSEGHFDFVRQFYETTALQPEKQLEEMLANGWTRVREGDYEVDVEVADMRHIPPHVEEFLLRYPENIIVHVNDHNNKHISLDMDDISVGLQKAINRALQRKRIQGALSKKAMLDGPYWVAPNGTEYSVDTPTHFDWISENLDAIAETGINVSRLKTEIQDLPEEDDPRDNDVTYQLTSEIYNEMFEVGWTRISTDEEGGIGYGIQVENIKSIPSYVDNFLIKHPPNGSVYVEGNNQYVEIDDPFPSIQKAVNRALSYKRLQPVSALSEKEAAYADMPSDEQATQVIMVDVDDTIFHEHSDETIGEPIKGAKEVLEKLKAEGYYIVLDSHRGNTEEGQNEIKEFMDKYDIPYDEIYQGDKPLAWRYIDDRAIQMTDWASVLKQVEKAETKKEASLSQKYWIDPNGKEYVVEGRIGWDPVVGHLAWIEANKNLIDENLITDDVNQTAENMIASGWTRVTNEADNDFDVEVSDINHLPPYLDDFVAKHFEGKGIGIDDLDAKYIVITDPFPSLQKAVNKALRQPVTAALVLPIIDPNTLNRKEPYALFIGTQRYSKDVAVDLFDVFGEHPMITESNRIPTVTLEVLEREHIPVIGKELRAADKQPVQDLSGVVKTASVYGDSAWIAPDGKVFEFKSESHWDWIADNGDIRDQYGIGNEIYDFETGDEAIDFMLEHDWARFGDMGFTETGLQVKNIYHIPPFIFNYINKFSGKNKGIAVADIAGRHVQMPVDEFVLGQKAVDKALQQKRMTTAQLGSKYDYSSTHFLLPPEIAEKIIRWGVENIPEEEIVHDPDGTKGIQVESHITLKYGLLTDDFEEVKKVLEGEKGPHVKFGKTTFFEPEGKDYDVIVIDVESKDLQGLSKKLCSSVKCNDAHDKYNPHVTVAYVKKGLGKKYEGKDVVTGEELDLNTLTFSPKIGEKRELELKKGTEKEASRGMAAWLAPDGKVFYLGDSDSPTHGSWVTDNLLLLESKYGFNTKELLADDPQEVDLSNTLMYAGWVRVGDIFGGKGFGIQVDNLKTIPSFVFDYISKLSAFGAEDDITLEDIDNNWVTLSASEAAIGQKAVNKALQQKRLQTQSSFMPSNTDLAPSDDWAGTVGYPTNESMDAPQNKSDEETWYSPENDRPRTKNFLKRMLSLFQKPLSKKEPKEVVPVKEADVNKTAADYLGLWIDPSGKVYDLGDERTHAEFIIDNVAELEKYGITFSPKLLKQLQSYWKNVRSGYENVDMPDIGEVWNKMIDSGWIRIGDVSGRNQEFGIDAKDITHLPPYLDDILAQRAQDGWNILVEDWNRAVVVTYPFKSLQQAVNKALSSPTKTATVKEAVRLEYQSWWIDPNGKRYTAGLNHAHWIWSHRELLETEYGIDFHGKFPKSFSGDIGPIFHEFIEDMISKGWTAVGLFEEGIGCNVRDVKSIPSGVFSFLSTLPLTTEEVMFEDLSGNSAMLSFDEIPFGQKAINEVLQQQRLQSSLKEASYNHAYWIDPNGKVYTVRPNKEAKDFYSHADWIADNLKLLQEQYGFHFDNSDRRSFSTQVTVDDLINAGWVRIGDAFGTDWGITVKDLNHIPSSVDDLLAKFAPEGSIITVATPSNWSTNYTFEWPVKSIQQTVSQIKQRREYYQQQPVMAKQAKQWTIPKELINQPGMDWGWADYIYDYVEQNWQDLLVGWLELDPKNYVKPAVIIEQIYKDEGAVSAWVHIEFVNTAGQSDAYMKLVITGDVHYEPSYEPEGVETTEYLDNWEIEVLDFGKSDELEKTSGYGPTNYKSPATPDDLYQDTAWGFDTTLSDEEDEKFLDQNGADGYPNRWMGRHRGPYYTNEGKVVKMLEETSALETLPPQQSITEDTNAGTAILMDDGSIYFSDESNMVHVKFIKRLGLPPEHIVSGGYIKDGIYHDTGPRSDTMRYVEMAMAQKRVDQKYKKHQTLGKKDIKAAISGQVVNTILQLIEHNGGATFNLSKGNLVGTDAYAVAIYPDREQIVPEVDFDTLEGYLTQNEDLLSNSNNSFGAWVSGGKTYLDVVATVKDLNMAMKLGLKHNQLAIFNLKTLQEIPIQRLASLKQAGNVINIQGVNVYKNPSKEQVTALWKNASYYVLRWIIDDLTGDFYFWDAADLTHDMVMGALGIIWDQDYNNKYTGEIQQDADIQQALNYISRMRSKLLKTVKQAAVYSDREMQKEYDKVYSERWPDDSAPIDGGNEYYDWSELGSNDYPNPKDEEKEHVYMDLLEDPAKANFPAGLPEYWVTFYDSQPQTSDEGGI